MRTSYVTLILSILSIAMSDNSYIGITIKIIATITIVISLINIRNEIGTRNKKGIAHE